MTKARPLDEAAIADADARVADLLKEAREVTNKADDIENAVYDLKAVNPHRKAEVDQRTLTELLNLADAQGLEVAKAIAVLRALLTRSQ